MRAVISITSCLAGAVGLWLAAVAPPAFAQEAGAGTGMMQGGKPMQPMMMSPGMMMPSMDPARGRKLFAEKGCVVCHSVNGIGGRDAAALDASTMPGMTDPFDFVANMWRGAAAMIDMQREELGEQVEFTGQELADIIAFLHHEDEQKKFSDADIPPKMKALLKRMGEPEETPQKGMGPMKGMDMKNSNGQTGTGN